MADKIIHVMGAARSRKRIVAEGFIGNWRVTKLEGFDSDYIDLCGPAKMEIGPRGEGHINFGAFGAAIDGRMDHLADEVFRFSFEGEDEGDPFIGYGYCLIDGDEMRGCLFRNFGDDFYFLARRMKKK